MNISMKRPQIHAQISHGEVVRWSDTFGLDPNSTSRISAQIISGIGFLGAGIILKSEIDKKITNLTTAAAIWFAASIGMAIGYEYYFLAAVTRVFAVGVPRIPYISEVIKKGEEE
jgi:putative Mg2+ transporter-C (MgtC) family protein